MKKSHFSSLSHTLSLSLIPQAKVAERLIIRNNDPTTCGKEKFTWVHLHSPKHITDDLKMTSL